MPQSRRTDGKPETPADTRFFDLREAGHTGPIDQDGVATSEQEFLERNARNWSNER